MRSKQLKAAEAEWVHEIVEGQRENALIKEKRRKAQEEKRQLVVTLPPACMFHWLSK